MALSLLPAILLVHSPLNWSLASATLYLSSITGYVGIVMLLWMFVIGAKSFFGLIFTDLAPVLTVHKWLGKYGSVFILLHPVLIVVSYGKNVLYPLLPAIGTSFERNVTLGRVAFLLVIVIWCSSVLMRKKLGRRPWKYIHYLAYVSLPFALLHVPHTGSQFITQTALKLYYFSLVILFFIFLLIRVHAWLSGGQTSYAIVRHQLVADNTYLLELAPTSANYLMPKRGQYVYIRDGFVSEEHPFSVVSVDKKNHTITLVYRVFGRFTEHLTTLAKGHRVMVSKPYGSFTHGTSAHSRPIVYIAGGIGITPFIDHILSNPPGGQWLFYANRTHASASFARQLQDKLGDHYVGIYSRDKALNANEENSYFNAALVEKHIPTPADCHYYLCGPETMIRSATRALVSLGITSAHIHTESFEL